MSDRSAAIFIITSDKDQTLKEAILKEKKEIMKIIEFEQWVKEFEFHDIPSKIFDDIFLDYKICYVVYSQFDMHEIYNIKKGESFLTIFSVNSAGSWQGCQVIPLKVNSLNNSNIEYYTEKEIISMPG